MSETPDGPGGGSSALRQWLLPLALLFGLAAVIVWTVTQDAGAEWVSPVGTLAAWAVFVPAAVAVRRIPARRAAAVVVLGSLLLGGAAISAAPATSNDAARYAWDGIVQTSGVSPYRYVPADAALQRLRPGWLFQPGAADGSCTAKLFPSGTEATTAVPGGTPLCTAINRPHVPTIYPALAEIYFLAVRLLPGVGAGLLAFQLAGFALSLAVTVLLLGFLRRTGRPLQQAVWWAWSPLVLFEAINNAHVDVLGAALLTAAVLLLVRGRALASGAAFGAAVAAKLIPAIAAPALLYRRPLRFVLAAMASFSVLYLPYLLASGWAVIGFLPGYLTEEGYRSKDSPRFTLLRLVLPQSWAVPAGVLLLAALAVYVWRRVDPEQPWDKQVLMIGGTLLIASPSYPWYALVLLPFVVLSRRYEFLIIPPVLAMMYFTGAQSYGQLVARLGLVAAVVVIAGTKWYRSRQAARQAAVGAAEEAGPRGSSSAPQ
ncbi:glycosyltransferase 87 family protein [Paenarthrobacter sp. PH39-S1]|uniref:glycosyltransferase 87 family protein n=1 Tax=Paenarthrobacter sp. PH39-S1 TaxID=3046204 RepID=UPI0024B94696|nr:glycosyltransferase 87 family protein [Paenarthrobacter sp. PH39-S1]MDJ0357284.1 glycosyltransferase 87 family protein [Paenarthrobacter sp. PH39-S1]